MTHPDQNLIRTGISVLHAALKALRNDLVACRAQANGSHKYVLYFNHDELGKRYLHPDGTFGSHDEFSSEGLLMVCREDALILQGRIRETGRSVRREPLINYYEDRIRSTKATIRFLVDRLGGEESTAAACSSPRGRAYTPSTDDQPNGNGHHDSSILASDGTGITAAGD